jgi:hypothetical protein
LVAGASVSRLTVHPQEVPHMLRRTTLGFFTLAIAGSLAMYACGGSSSDNGTSGTTHTDPTKEGAQPPAQPAGNPPATGSGSTVVALDELFLGDTDPATGQVDSNAWRKIGYNIDGLVSTKNGTNHCKPVEGATPSSVKTDGDNGIDNSFGENLVPIIGSLVSDLSTTVSQSLQDGTFTVMLKMDNIGDPSTDQTGIAAALYGGANFDSMVDCTANPTDPNCSAPKFDGTDTWPVVPELLNNGDITNPKVQFPSSYVTGGTWVSGSQGEIDLSVSIQGFDLSLKIAHAVITMDLSGTGASTKATNGIISGVIPTEQLVTELKKVAGGFDQSLCSGATLDSITQEIAQASDIMQDGSNGNPSVTCDGISVGIGFTAKAVNLGAVAPAASAPSDPCADAGTGDGG